MSPKCVYCESGINLTKDKDNYFCKECYKKHNEFKELVKGHEKMMEALGKL